jgi:hypothetical protein
MGKRIPFQTGWQLDPTAPHYINRIKVFVPGNRRRLNELD